MMWRVYCLRENTNCWVKDKVYWGEKDEITNKGVVCVCLNKFSWRLVSRKSIGVWGRPLCSRDSFQSCCSSTTLMLTVRIWRTKESRAIDVQWRNDGRGIIIWCRDICAFVFSSIRQQMERAVVLFQNLLVYSFRSFLASNNCACLIWVALLYSRVETT